MGAPNGGQKVGTMESDAFKDSLQASKEELFSIQEQVWRALNITFTDVGQKYIENWHAAMTYLLRTTPDERSECRFTLPKLLKV